MNFWKWIGSDQRVEEALDQSTSYNISPSTNDVEKAISAPFYWEEIAFGASNNNNAAPSKLSLWSDYAPQQTEGQDAEMWGNVAKR